MATHSSVLAWRIPGTEEPGGLPSMGSHRVRHDWSDLAAAAAADWIKQIAAFPIWCCAMLSHFSCVQLFAPLWTIACEAPLSMRFSRQEYWTGLPCPSPEDLPDLEVAPLSLTSPALAGGFFVTSATWEALQYGRFHLICWGLNKTKRRKGEFTLFLPGSFQTGTWILCAWTRVSTTDFPGAQAFDIGLELCHQLFWISNLLIADCGTFLLHKLCDPIAYNKLIYSNR